MIQLDQLPTEQRNPKTACIDRLSTLEMVRRINDEDKKVAYAVEKELDNIAEAVDAIYAALKDGGRLIYCGCGTSGRLGILDAVECPPTFSTDPEMVRGVIAGGEPALFRAVEGAEDNMSAGKEDMIELGLCAKDILVGIAASGRTPYVLGAMAYAKEIGARTVAVTCNKHSQMNAAADMVLNMLSTGAMIRLGKVYGNLMVDVKPTNEKLVRRAISIVSTAANVSEDESRQALEQCGFSAKTAIVMLTKGLPAQEAERRLAENGGIVARALDEED